jgi:hypothetical protein
MRYQVVVASSGGDNATIAKSFIIALEGPDLTWYTRLPPLSIDSWKRLRDKFLLNFQGYRPDTDALVELSLCKQQEKETLREYYRKFLTLKSQLPSVDDHIAIHYSISGLRAGVLYSPCIRDPPKNLQELYQLFEKYARSEELHQRKVESQRKPKDPPQSSRTWTRPSQPDSGRDSHNQQQVHNIANQHPAEETARRQEYPPKAAVIAPEEEAEDGRSSRVDCLFHGKDCAHPSRDCPETKATKDRMSRAQSADNQRVVAHTYHHHQQQPYNEHIQHPPNHAYQHPQEVQVLPHPPPHHPNPHHHNHPQAPKQEDFAEQPYRGVIHMIIGGSSVDFETKRQKRDHYRSVNHVALTGPVVQTRWSHVPLTFDARDVDLRSAPHVDAMVINYSVAGWDIHKVLVNNGSQVDIIFLHAFDRMGISHILLKPSDNPLYDFGGKGTFPVSKIELPLSFGTAPNARSEQVTFDIVDMVYPYNAIMGRGSINKFEAAIHGLYLCMKILGPQGMIIVYGNQQTAHNIERDFVPGQRNVHCLTAKREGFEGTRQVADEKIKAQLQSNDGTKAVPLDPATPKQTVIISEDLTSRDEEKPISCLSQNKDIFTWSALDLVGVNCTIIEHGLGIDPSVRPRKQRLRKMSNEKTEAAKAEVHRLLEANFIEPIAYPTWLANVVMVQKKSGKWRM